VVVSSPAAMHTPVKRTNPTLYLYPTALAN
jgi:hypothetical protein